MPTWFHRSARLSIGRAIQNDLEQLALRRSPTSAKESTPLIHIASMAFIEHTLLVLFALFNVAQATRNKFWLEADVPFRPGVRSYKNYTLDKITGFLRPVRATVEIGDKPKLHTERLGGHAHDFTTFEAVPYSLEQFLRPNGHALLDTAWDINEIAPVVHLHMIWMEETNGVISLPCWSPAQALLIEYNQTTMRGHRRTWLLGQGHTFSLSLASAFGYKKEPSSEALFISPFKGLQAGHAVFTCMLSRKRPSDDKFSPRLSFIQTHMIYYQTSDEALQTARGKVEVDLELVAFTPESHGPPCHLYPNEYNQVVCREAAWQQIRSMDVRSRNAGYRYYKNPRLNPKVRKQLKSDLSSTIADFCRLYSCTGENPRLNPKVRKQLKSDLSSTIADFCRLYSCTGEVVLESVEPKYTNVTVPEVLHFFGDHVKHPNQCRNEKRLSGRVREHHLRRDPKGH
ncbi:unnamed protein product [Dicrocoelium dendriticum]|nr:unnamed protein product [Dicrocoelium dendriticum]